jgi:MoaA/NifB/PqqE/SkfB family radical SAM enzyme
MLDAESILNPEFKLEEYLSSGVENLVKNAMKASLKNPKESLFISKYALSSITSRKIRVKHEQKGEHIPPFLIASITSSCNLHCKGCYARENESCGDNSPNNQLTTIEWEKVFREASSLGIGFILLAGGEPFIRCDVIESAALYKNIIFPIFTNGTMMDEKYLNLLDKNRNLIPVLSIEGNEHLTDYRRGVGVYSKLITTMDIIKDKGILYGASITVTTENIHSITSDEFISDLYSRGCKVVFFIEYVPVDITTKELAPTNEERKFLNTLLSSLRKKYEDVIFISFPGDEKSSGGCLAAGRGFFHINSHGGAEPCPFSPFSDTNIKNTSLIEALKSPLFIKLNDSHALLQEHEGGCVLFDQEDKVKKLCEI